VLAWRIATGQFYLLTTVDAVAAVAVADLAAAA
jgi:hypothetical protein